MKAFTILSLASVATAAAAGHQESKPVRFAAAVGKAPQVSAKDKAATVKGVKPNANPSPDTGKTYFTYRGWTGDWCDGNQNMAYEYTIWASPPDLRVFGTHSVSFDNYGDCKDIQCEYKQLNGDGRATYHYHQGYCYNINTGWEIDTVDCNCLYCNGDDCHT